MLVEIVIATVPLVLKFSMRIVSEAFAYLTLNPHRRKSVHVFLLLLAHAHNSLVKTSGAASMLFRRHPPRHV